MISPDDRLLSPQEASRLLNELGIPGAPQTLAKWRCEGGGPRFHRVGRTIRYRYGDLTAWIAAKVGRSLQSTSDLAAASPPATRLHHPGQKRAASSVMPADAEP